MNMIQKLGLCWRILRQKTGGLFDHALRELPRANGDEMQALMNSQLLELILVFGTHGHSGLSACYAIDALGKLLRYEPLGPLTGEADEWHEVGDGVFQNRRCSRVFKSAARFCGQPYDLDGRVFWEWCERELAPDEEGYPGLDRFKSYFTNLDSAVPITFPYTPTTEYVERVPLAA